MAAPAWTTGPTITLLAFFVSGAAGVMHQVSWSRQLVGLVGAEAYAQALALAVFMGGLALGAAAARRFADGPRPLRAYLLLELAVAAYALLLPLLLAGASAAYLRLVAGVFEHDGARLALRFGLTALTVLPPATLMGATLPVLTAALAPSAAGNVRGTVGALYAANAFGAVVGTAATGFVLLPLGGTWAALAAAVLANLLAAAMVLPRMRVESGQAAESPRAAAAAMAAAVTTAPPPRLSSALVLLALFLSGLAAMGYEVLTVRVGALAAGSSAQAFAVMVMAFVFGIAVGGLAASRWRRQPSTAGALAIAQLAAVLGFLLVTPLVARLPWLLARVRTAVQDGVWGYAGYQALTALVFLAVLLLPTAALGFAFPLAADLLVVRRDRAGSQVGGAYAVATAGNVLGVLLTALVLLPRLGIEGGFAVLGALQLGGALALLLLEPRRRRALAVAGVAIGAVALYLGFGTGWSRPLTFAPDHFVRRLDPAGDPRDARTLASFADWQDRFVITRQPGRFAQVRLEHDAHNTVLAFGPDRARGGTITLAVNNKTDASTLDDLETQLLLGHAPLFLAPRAREVLVIGHGVGITAGATLRHQPERVDLVEISPAVLRVDPLFANANDYVLTDPRVRVYVDDGQSFLRAVPRRYDVIVSEPSNPWVAGVGDLFTADFLQAARDRMRPGGVFTFWFHTYNQDEDTTRLLLRTLGSVFPQVEIFADSQFGNVVALGFNVPAGTTPRLDFAAMEARFRDPAVGRDLDRLGLPNLLAFLALHRGVQIGADGLAGPGPVNTLAWERLRHLGPQALFRGASSFLLERGDPLLNPAAAPGPGRLREPLVDRYAADRAARGDPVREAEYVIAADWLEGRGEHGAALGRALRSRAARAAEAAGAR